MAKNISIEIGFEGGASTGVLTTESALEAFTKTVSSRSDEWFTLESADGGEVLIDVSKIVFVRSGARNRSIGFTPA